VPHKGQRWGRSLSSAPHSLHFFGLAIGLSRYEHPLVEPQLGHAKHEPAGFISTPQVPQ
jgi:hypothetical protein